MQKVDGWGCVLAQTKQSHLLKAFSHWASVPHREKTRRKLRDASISLTTQPALHGGASVAPMSQLTDNYSLSHHFPLSDLKNTKLVCSLKKLYMAETESKLARLKRY